MSLLLPFAVLLVALVPVLLIGITTVVLIVGSSRRAPDPRTVHVRRRAAVFTIVAAVAGAGALVVLLTLPGLRYGLDYSLAPLAIGIAMTLVILVHELTWPRPVSSVRTAQLARRTALGLVPKWLLVMGLSGTVVLWMTDIASSAVAGPDGRSLSRVSGDTVGNVSPFPGAYYAVPTLVASAVVLVLAALTVWVIRNRNGTAVDDQDAELRRLSAHRALRGAAFGQLATAAGHALVAGMSITNLYPDGPPHLAGMVLLVLSPILGVASVLALILPSRAILRMAPLEAPVL
jgi:hypothetical protein